MAGRAGGWVGERAACNAPGGRFRTLVWSDRLVRRGRFSNRPIECLNAADKLAEAEKFKEFSVDSSISFREPGDFAAVWGLYRGGAFGRDVFLSSYSATKAFKVGRMWLSVAKPLGAGPRA